MTYASGASAIAVPGCPAFACWTASIASVRIVSIESCSRSRSATVAPFARSGRNDTGEVAVVIASNLRKEIAGDVLFEGVSFKVERRERLALSGPNGAGKTTLLRML